MTISVYADPSGNYATMSIGGSEKFRLNSDGTATLGGIPVQRMLNLGTKTTTSGTAIDFSPSDGTGIPSWAKRVTLFFHGVSTNGSSAVTVQIGAGSVDVTDYTGSAGSTGASSVVGLMGNGFATEAASGAGVVRHGHCTLTHTGLNVWIFSSVQGRSDNVGMNIAGGSKTLGGVLDRIRITTTNGTDTFDLGQVSVIIEG